MKRNSPVTAEPTREMQTFRNLEPGIIVRGIYFLLVGCWLSATWIVAVYILIFPIVTMPVFNRMIRQTPYVMTLRPMEPLDSPAFDPTVWQRNIILRTIYFMCIGFWLVAVWLTVAWLLGFTIVGRQRAYRMFDQAPTVATLARR